MIHGQKSINPKLKWIAKLGFCFQRNKGTGKYALVELFKHDKSSLLYRDKELRHGCVIVMIFCLRLRKISQRFI